MLYCNESESRPTTYRDIPVEQCAHCGAAGTLRLHGYHRKSVVSWNGGHPEAHTRAICRVICTRCRKTESLMPTTLVAGSSPTVELCVHLALWRRKAMHAPPEARAWFLSHSSCRRRVVADASRLAEALDTAIEGLAAALAEASRDVGAFAAGFAGEHGTTPFSRLRPVSVAARAGGRDGPAGG